MATIDVNVNMEDGSGLGTFVSVDENNLFFSTSGVKNMDLDPGPYIAVISGHEPSSSSVTITFSEAGAQLASRSYSTPTFAGTVNLNVT